MGVGREGREGLEGLEDSHLPKATDAMLANATRGKGVVPSGSMTKPGGRERQLRGDG